LRQELLPKANATCKVCGNPYYVCTNCLKYRDRGIYGWKLVADTPQCYQMYMVMNQYKEGTATKEDAVKVFNAIQQYASLPEFIEPYKEIYAEIIGIKPEGKQEEPVVEAVKTVPEKKEQYRPYKKQKYGK